MLSTVLIIDKRKELPAKYKKCIDSSEARTIITHTLKDGILAVQELEPDMIIVSDSIEEDLSSFCQKIRALTFNFRPVIIGLSKSADYLDRIKILENGADDFISEPVNIDEFKTRIKAHLRRDIELNLDTKTLLPNQKYVRKILKRTLKEENKAVLNISIENINAYKTVYSEVAGDKIFQSVIAIAKSALDENDFIGLLDETNLIVVTNKFGAEKLAEFLTFAFDSVVSKFYSETDAQRGYMMLKGERYAGMRVNFVSLLIGGITEGFNLLTSVDSLLERLYSAKKLARLPYGSNYAIERPQISGKDSIIEEKLNRNIFIKESDDSLNLLIRTTLELQGYDVDADIDLESTVQPKIIILDSGNDLEELNLVKDLKQNGRFSSTKIIVTSNTHDKSAILSSGADLYLPKPYEICDLIRWVEYFLKK